MRNPVIIDPDARITDLIGRLGDDSKRLLRDEVRLAKMEAGESVHTATRGVAWMAIALGVAILALVALTILGIVLIRHFTGRLWIGALVTGVVEIIVGAVLLKLGVGTLGEQDYTLGEARGELRQTARWAADEARDMRGALPGA